MKNIRKFANQSAYLDYTEGDNIVLPCISLIVNGGDSPSVDDPYADNGPSRIEYSRIGTEFVQVANGGTMYFTNQVIGNVAYTADILGDMLVIKTRDLTTGRYTNDAYVDEENESIVINYPNGRTQTVALA